MAASPVILHGGNDWIVIDKPVGWHTTSGPSEAPDLESWLRSHVEACAELDEAGLVQRLDQHTGGCVLVALHDDARDHLRDAVSGRGTTSKVLKTYLAHVSTPMPASGSFELYFSSRYKRSRKITVSTAGQARERGLCTWEVVTRGIVQVELIGPGRRHQIRAGLAHMGWPLVGDALYGGADTSEHPHLHAWRLDIDGIVVDSEPPDWAG